MRLRVQSFLWDEQGATAVEYGIIIALIVLVIIVALSNVATNATAMFTKVAGNV